MGANSKTSPGKREGKGELKWECNIPEKLSVFWTQLLKVSPQFPGVSVVQETRVSFSPFMAILTQVNGTEGVYSALPVVLMHHLTPSFECVFAASKRRTRLSREASGSREI